VVKTRVKMTKKLEGEIQVIAAIVATIGAIGLILFVL